MEISLKTGIEHRFSLSEFKSTVKLHVLLGKLRNFMEFSHGILKYNFTWMFSMKKDGGKLFVFQWLEGILLKFFPPRAEKRKQNRVSGVLRSKI